MKFESSSKVTIEFNWEEVGKITPHEKSDFKVPDAPHEPAVYIIRSPAGIYVGETSSLKRRLKNYRRPGGSEPSLPINLDKKHERMFVENAVITVLGLQGSFNWNDPSQ